MGQQDEATFGLFMLDDYELDTVFFRCRFGALSRVALVYKSYFDTFARHLLYLRGQLPNLSAFLFVGRRHDRGNPPGVAELGAVVVVRAVRPTSLMLTSPYDPDARLGLKRSRRGAEGSNFRLYQAPETLLPRLVRTALQN